jgi:hypothetical protein
MRGYHFLMRLAHMFNVIAQHARELLEAVKDHGVRGFIQYSLQTVAGPWLDPDTVRARLASPSIARVRAPPGPRRPLAHPGQGRRPGRASALPHRARY